MTHSSLPKKLKKDSIQEALVEIRFECSEISEVIIGRLVDHSEWRSWNKSRLAAADIPSAIRESDAALRYQPEIELIDESGNHRIRVGGHAISCHVTNNYCGWDGFAERISSTIAALFELLGEITVTRIGLRYINAMTKTDHLIEGVSSLSLGVSIGDKSIADHLNLSFFTPKSADTGIMVKVVSPMFLQNKSSPDTSAIIDIDVFTVDGYMAKGKEEVFEWVKQAHEKEKEAFFALLPPEILSELIEE